MNYFSNDQSKSDHEHERSYFYLTIYQSLAIKFVLILGVVAARDGALTFMVGAEKEYYDEAEVLLQNMAKNVVHCGAVGTGQVILNPLLFNVFDNETNSWVCVS